MNRRTALMLSMLLGGLIPRGLWAQTAGRKSSKTRDKALQPVSRSDDPDDAAVPPTNDEPPAPFAPEPGFQWRRYPITRYTKVASGQVNPQKAIIDWIFKRTGMPDWHGEKIAVLSASKTELRAYNSPEILKQVDEIVERFTNATEDVLSVHVQFLAAVDTRWRYSVYSRLTFVGSGPQGQQIWTMRLEDAALVLSQMQVQQGFRKLADQRVEMINGQTLTIKTSEPRGYASGLQRDGVAGAGFQPKADRLEESIVLKLSPLLNFDGDALDAMIDLTINTVRSFHRTKVIAPRDVGPSEMSVDVPESSPDTPGPDSQELATGPDAGDLGRDPSGNPRQEGRLVQPPDSRNISHGHRGARRPRRRDGYSRQGRISQHGRHGDEVIKSR